MKETYNFCNCFNGELEKKSIDSYQTLNEHLKIENEWLIDVL